MHLYVQAVILGVLIGGVYALMSSGLTLVFGIMRVINVAQGAMVILGAYLSYSLYRVIHIDPLVSILLIAPVMFALGVGIHRLFIRSLRADTAEEMSLLVTWATALAVEGTLAVIYTTTYRSTITSYAQRSWVIGGYRVAEVRVIGFLMSVAIVAALYVLLARTRFGRSVRATVQNPTSAMLLGVDADRVSALGFGIGIATAAAAGAVFGMIYPFNPGSHYDLISRLLSIVVLGGLGSLGGAVVASLILGVAESLVAVAISPIWSSFVFFVVLLAVLLFRPQGLFGVRERGAL
jgi:branched-chain amino acid transport system permease protein